MLSDDFLTKGETVIWEGRPELWPYTFRAFGISLFGFVWLIIPIVMLIVLHDGNSVSPEIQIGFDLFLVPFFAIGISMVLAPIYYFVSHKYVRYMLTNKRVVIVQGIFQQKIKFLDYDRIVNVSIVTGIVDHRFSSGDIRFFSGEVGFHGQAPFSKHDTFCNIQSPYGVHKKVQEIINLNTTP